MQPKTPCSASGECGGSRSTPETAEVVLRDRVRFGSGLELGLSGIESIIRGRYQKTAAPSNGMLITTNCELNVNNSYSTGPRPLPSQYFLKFRFSFHSR
jgi:hypothetical protein